MRRVCWYLLISVVCPTVILAGAPDRAELLGNPRFFEKAAEPSFVRLTAEALQDQVQVISRRSFAAFGFNTPGVQMHLPRCDNTVYAVVEFSPARLVAADDRDVPYERERGIYDHDTHSDELRFAPLNGKTPVAFSRAQGTILLRYPVRMETLSLKINVVRVPACTDIWLIDIIEDPFGYGYFGRKASMDFEPDFLSVVSGISSYFI